MASLITVKHQVFSAITDTLERVYEMQAVLKTVETKSVIDEYESMISEKKAEIDKLQAAYDILES